MNDEVVYSREQGLRETLRILATPWRLEHRRPASVFVGNLVTLFVPVQTLVVLALFMPPLFGPAHGAVLLCGVLAGAVWWWYGSGVSRVMSSNAYLELWHLTPLRPRTLFRYMFDILPAQEFGYLVLAPAAFLFVCYLWPWPDYVPPHHPRLLIVNVLLLHYAAPFVALSEHLTRRRWLTGFVFASRHPFRRHWRSMIALATLFLLAVMFSGGAVWTKSVSLVETGLDFLLSIDPIGTAIVFIVAPLAGMGLAAQSPDGAPLLWAFAAFLVVAIAWSLRGVQDALRPRPANEVLNHPYARWLEERTRKKWDMVRSEPKRDDREPTGASVPYRTDLSVMRQVARHARRWSWTRPRSWWQWTTLVLGGFVRLSFSLAIWPALVAGTLLADEPAPIPLGVTLVAGWACMAVSRVPKVMTPISLAMPIPLRWTSVFAREYTRVILWRTVADVCFVGCMWVDGGSWSAVLVVFVTLHVTRVLPVLCACIEASHDMGCRWPARVALVMHLSLFAGSIVWFVAYGMDLRSRPQWEATLWLTVWTPLVVWLAIAGVCVFLVWVCLRRCGPYVPGYPAGGKCAEQNKPEAADVRTVLASAFFGEDDA